MVMMIDDGDDDGDDDDADHDDYNDDDHDDDHDDDDDDDGKPWQSEEALGGRQQSVTNWKLSLTSNSLSVSPI